MERLLDSKEVGHLLGLKDGETIRRIMRQMVHMEKPLRVTESAVERWVNERTYRASGEIMEMCRRKRLPTVPEEDRIPRRRRNKEA